MTADSLCTFAAFGLLDLSAKPRTQTHGKPLHTALYRLGAVLSDLPQANGPALPESAPDEGYEFRLGGYATLDVPQSGPFNEFAPNA